MDAKAILQQIKAALPVAPKFKSNNRKHGASITGLTFGMLFVERADPRQHVNGNRFYQCRCSCGGQRLVRRDKLVGYAGPRSCGCTPRSIAAEAAPYPLPLLNLKPGMRLLLPRDPHTGEEHYISQARKFAEMFSPRGEAGDCQVFLERELTAKVPTFVLRIICHADEREVSIMDNTVRRLFKNMSKKLQTRERLK